MNNIINMNFQNNNNMIFQKKLFRKNMSFYNKIIMKIKKKIQIK